MTDNKPMTQGRKIVYVKMLLSSLFARKQEYMIVDGNVPNKLIFTNIPPDRVTFYRPDIDDTYCAVEMTPYMSSLFYETFPQFKQIVACISLRPFMSALNKRLAVDKEHFPDIQIADDKVSLTMWLPMTEGQTVCEILPVGELLMQDIPEFYRNVLAEFDSYTTDKLYKEIDVSSAYKYDQLAFVDMQLYNYEKDRQEYFRLPIQDGVNFPSFKEYFVKKKLPWHFKLEIQYKPKSSVAKITCLHKDDWVNLRMITPGHLWFLFEKKF